jgi:hypothetical protein
MEAMRDDTEFNANEALEESERHERLQERYNTHYLALRSHLHLISARDRQAQLALFIMKYEKTVLQDGYRYYQDEYVEQQWQKDAWPLRNHRCTKLHCPQFHIPQNQVFTHPFTGQRETSTGEVFICRRSGLVQICPIRDACKYTSVDIDKRSRGYSCRLTGRDKGSVMERVPEYDENAKISLSRISAMKTRENADMRNGNYNSDSDASYDGDEGEMDSYDMADESVEDEGMALDLDGHMDEAEIKAQQDKVQEGSKAAPDLTAITTVDPKLLEQSNDEFQLPVTSRPEKSLNHMFFRFNTLSEALGWTHAKDIDGVVSLMMDEEAALGLADYSKPTKVQKKRKKEEDAEESVPKKRRNRSTLGQTRTPEERITHHLRDPDGRREKLAQIIRLLTKHDNKMAMFNKRKELAIQEATEKLIATKRRLHITACSQMAMYELWWSVVLQRLPEVPQPVSALPVQLYVNMIMEVWEICVYSPFANSEKETLNFVKIAFAVLYAMADAGHFYIDCSLPALELGKPCEIDGVDLTDFHIPMLPHGRKLSTAIIPATQLLELKSTVRSSISFNDKTASQGSKQLKQCFVSTVDNVRTELINNLRQRPEQSATLLRDYIAACIGLRCTGHGRGTTGAVH